ncbi:MAG: (d)CMP kinase [Desulfococcaceae bacterium]
METVPPLVSLAAMNQKLLITIDGPAGSGKTTVSRLLAERLSYTYVDTGALYRGIALAVQTAGIYPDDENALKSLCQSIRLCFIRNEKGLRLLLNSEDISGRIRTPEISMMASAVSAKTAVREHLFQVQRDMGAEKGAVFEGRDMGTVVFPDADLKFFLHADLKVRAARRYTELRNHADIKAEDVEKDMEKRDHNDSSRKIAPLCPAEDAICIDTSRLSVSQVVEQMLNHISGFRKAKSAPGK